MTRSTSMYRTRRTDTSVSIEPTAISSTVTKNFGSPKGMYFDLSGSASPNETTVPNFRAAVFVGQQQLQNNEHTLRHIVQRPTLPCGTGPRQYAQPYHRLAV
jgi:hypothetical protein